MNESEAMKLLREKRERAACYRMVSALAALCAANEGKIIDLLSGYLWDEEEAEQIKRENEDA